MEHVQPFEPTFPWRTAALAACVLALAELAGLIVLVGVGLIHVHHAAGTPARGATAPTGRRTAEAPPPPALRPRSHVSVLVLNGNGIAHAAGTEATKLLSVGYRRATAADAPQAYASSLVLFRPGWEREAGRLARDAGIRIVTPLDGRLPGSDAGDELVLILGAH